MRPSQCLRLFVLYMVLSKWDPLSVRDYLFCLFLDMNYLTDQASQHYIDSLMHHSWYHWHTRWFTHKLMTEQRDRINAMADRSRLRRIYIRWRLCILYTLCGLTHLLAQADLIVPVFTHSLDVSLWVWISPEWFCLLIFFHRTREGTEYTLLNS